MNILRTIAGVCRRLFRRNTEARDLTDDEWRFLINSAMSRSERMSTVRVDKKKK